MIAIQDWFLNPVSPLLIAGPCSVESEEQMLLTARQLSRIPELSLLRGGVWKPRTRPEAFEGRGEDGLRWLQEAKRETGLPVATEVATPEHVELALHYEVDALWIGARTVVSPFTVQQLADALRGAEVAVFVKNPVSPDLHLWLGAIERFRKAGLTRLAAIHRGFQYYKESPYRNYPLWEVAVELKRQAEVPVITDISHICGRRDLLLDTAQRSVDLAFDGLMVESHCMPDAALTDAAQQVTPEALSELLRSLTPRSRQANDKDTVLATLRGELDDIDAELLQLLARRMNVSSQIGEYKKQNGITVVQLERWKQLLADHVATGKELGLDEELVQAVFEAVHQASIERQL